MMHMCQESDSKIQKIQKNQSGFMCFFVFFFCVFHICSFSDRIEQWFYCLDSGLTVRSVQTRGTLIGRQKSELSMARKARWYKSALPSVILSICEISF